jgi:hypothetical protein
VERTPSGSDAFNVPLAILQKASTLDANYSNINVAVGQDPNLDGSYLQILPIFHFAEINRTNPYRRFDIYGLPQRCTAVLEILPSTIPVGELVQQWAVPAKPLRVLPLEEGGQLEPSTAHQRVRGVLARSDGESHN